MDPINLMGLVAILVGVAALGHRLRATEDELERCQSRLLHQGAATIEAIDLITAATEQAMSEVVRQAERAR